MMHVLISHDMLLHTSWCVEDSLATINNSELETIHDDLLEVLLVDRFNLIHDRLFLSSNKNLYSSRREYICLCLD